MGKVTTSSQNNITSPNGNSLAVFVDGVTQEMKVKDVNGNIQPLSDFVCSGGGGSGSSPFQYDTCTSIKPCFGNNNASGSYSTIGGGFNNTSSGISSFVGGGTSNIAFGYNDVIGGGQNNFTNVTYGENTISGGQGNSIPNGYNSFIGGGNGNIISVSEGTIGGGSSNTSSGFTTQVIEGNLWGPDGHF